MKVVVFGGNGFIGSHIVDCLLNEGHTVRVFDRFAERYRKPLHGVEYLFGRFDNSIDVSEALRNVDAVCHLICSSVPGTSNASLVSDIECNLINTVQLLEKMREKEVYRILYLSSGGAVYGEPKSLPVTEGEALNPISSYGIMKLTVEKYLLLYQKIYDFQPIIIRPSNVYGSRQSHCGVQGLIGTLLTRLLEGKEMEIWGDGSTVRDFLHVKDLARLCAKSLSSNVSGVFNAGSGNGYSIHDIIDITSKLAGRKVRVIYGEKRLVDVKEIVLDSSRAKKYLDWEYKISLSEGIKEHLSWALCQKT
ncbi:NAD-dependent epimerase/dehydratase family protein [Mariprofundus ferrooxydans]|nr:NAD-dependent epimerase/dehydratase family protein [Mariprofundus ferrooxydans]